MKWRITYGASVNYSSTVEVEMVVEAVNYYGALLEMERAIRADDRLNQPHMQWELKRAVGAPRDGQTMRIAVVLN